MDMFAVLTKLKLYIKKYAHTQENYMYKESVRQCSFVRSYFIFTLLFDGLFTFC